MTETIRFSKIGIDDLSLGSGSFEVRLADERVVAKEQVNLRRLAPDVTDGRVLFMDTSDIGDNASFTFDDASSTLTIPSINGGSAPGDDVVIDSTSHATKGDILLQPTSGNVGIGVPSGSSPDSELHVQAAGAMALTLENTSAVTTGDPVIQYKIAGTALFTLGVDDSDSNVFKIATGGSLGAAPAVAIDSTGKIGVGEETPAGLLHLKLNSSGGASAQGSADEFIIENNGSTGISLLTPNTNTGSLYFCDPQSSTAASIEYNHSTDNFAVRISGAQVLNVNTTRVLINDSANTVNTSGLTVQQAGADDEILSLKSSDVNHTLSADTEVDTYCYIKKTNASLGGAIISGLSNSAIAMTVRGSAASEDFTRTSTSNAHTVIESYKGTGGALVDPSNNANVMAFKSGANTVVIFDEDGDIHVDGSGTLTTFDDYDDVALLTAVKTVMCSDMKQTLGDWLQRERDVLVQHGIISEGGFLSYKGVCGLMIDAFRQVDSRLRALEGEVAN